MLRLVKQLKTYSKEFAGERCMRSDRNPRFSEMERGKVLKDYMKRITNEENYCDHVEGDAVKGPVVCVSREEALQASNKMKTGKAPGPSEIS